VYPKVLRCGEVSITAFREKGGENIISNGECFPRKEERRR